MIAGKQSQRRANHSAKLSDIPTSQCATLTTLSPAQTANLAMCYARHARASTKLGNVLRSPRPSRHRRQTVQWATLNSPSRHNAGLAVYCARPPEPVKTASLQCAALATHGQINLAVCYARHSRAGTKQQPQQLQRAQSFQKQQAPATK